MVTARRKLAEHVYYPPEAIRLGLEGEVRLLLTLATGSAAFYAKWLRRKADGSPFPKATAGLLGLTLALLLVFALGLLKI